MRRIAVIGAGIAGLSAAFELERARHTGAEISYTLFEASERVGGALRTERKDGFLVELGADSFLSEKPWARELCRELGIEDQLIGSNDAVRQTWIFFGGRLHPLSKGMQFIVPASSEVAESELFSEETRQKLTKEHELRPYETHGDESVASFVERHFGKEYLERIAQPMLAGIYGGECERLSARAVMPKFMEMERAHGSLQRALEQRPKAANPKPIFTSLKPGMQTLATTLAAQLAPESIRLNSAVRALRRNSGGWQVSAADQAKTFDAVIIAAPAFVAAKLLRGASAELARELAQITYTSSVTVALAYDGSRVKLPAGFGVLVPSAEKRRMLACTFVHNKFPCRVPAGNLLVRAFFGGAHDETVVKMSDADLISLALKELKVVARLESAPEFAIISRWPRAMPQYDVGHLERVTRIRKLEGKLPSLRLCGSAYEGVGVPDCVRSGREAARAVIGRG